MPESRESLSGGGRKIAVITGTRAEYGLLYWAMRELQARGAELQLLVTGSHLSPDHGMTVRQIETDGFSIAARIDMELTSDRPLAIARSAARALAGIAEALDRLAPDIAVILGDRYEMLAAAQAAALLNIPIAHIHGGEVTEGALDESLRHAITKLSYWHFAAAEPYARRIAQLGEEPSRIFTVGAPGIDNLARLELLPRAALEKALGLPLDPPIILFTYHPETLAGQPVEKQIAAIVGALKHFPEATLIITGANADAGGRMVNEALQALAASSAHSLFRLSLGSTLYLSVMREAAVVAGNSSSGLIEAPALGAATVNIGDRQKGRLREPSILDCACEESAIMQTLQHALSREFQQTLRPSSRFGKPGEVAPRIAELLLTLPLPAPLRKAFCDRK